MPYIKQKDRARLHFSSEDAEPKTPGELNYKITILIREYFENNGANYQAINDVLGALTGAQLEFYRRVAAPYEDQKIKDNGDVY